MTKGALYKHYQNKRDIFDHIVTRMEEGDAKQAGTYELPEGTLSEMEEKYHDVSLKQFGEFCKAQFAYWTEDDFASSFRKMLTLEQFRSEEMQRLYQQYLVAGPLGYVRDIFASIDVQACDEQAEFLYALMFFFYSMYDGAEDKEKVMEQFEKTLDAFWGKSASSVFIRRAAGTSQTEQVVAANIDTVFLCMALNRDFNLRRLERYLSIAWDSGAVPVVVLTKTDLCDNPEDKRLAVEEVAMGTDILETSAVERDGISQILPYLQEGKTVAFIGSSGVGKSTLINCLLGEKYLATGDLRSDDKGHHTTTHRELLFLPNGGMVIDTPGMRELGMWDAEEGIDRAFEDIEELALRCRFRDCKHISEPGCAVRKAIDQGELSEERFLSYRKLKTENDYFEDSESYLAAKEKKFTEIAKINKKNRLGRKMY